MRLLITRHALTEHNISQMLQGDDDNLSSLGYEQISKLINRLKKEKIDIIISSDLKRCKITSEKIANELKLPLEYNSLLREKNDGDWIGKHRKNVDWDSLPGTFKNRKAPNGESLEELRERARKFFNILLNKYGDSDKTILIVSHGTFLRVFIGDIIGLDLKTTIFKTSIDNCSLTEIDVNKGYKLGFMLKYLNEKDFLN